MDLSASTQALLPLFLVYVSSTVTHILVKPETQGTYKNSSPTLFASDVANWNNSISKYPLYMASSSTFLQTQS